MAAPKWLRDDEVRITGNYTGNLAGVTSQKGANNVLNAFTGGDADAIHKSVANEISTLTEKTSLDNDDLFVIESSTNAGAKRKVKKSNLGSGGGVTITTGGWL